MGLEALIFDADGTLAETDELHRAAYNAAFKSHDLDWTWSPAIYARLPSAATTADVIRSYVAQYRNTDTGRRLLEALLDDLVAAKDAKYSRLIENGGAMLRPGVARLLREARNARVPIGITTLLNRNDFEFMLQNHLGVGAASICSVITCGQGVRAACGSSQRRDFTPRPKGSPARVSSSQISAIPQHPSRLSMATLSGITSHRSKLCAAGSTRINFWPLNLSTAPLPDNSAQ